MKLIVDSGSSKADWIAINTSGETLFSTQTLGLNPEVLTKDEILERIHANETLVNTISNVTHLHFYGAGCGTDRMKNFLANVFQELFKKAIVAVFEDTFAAVFATTPKNEKAIVCILGTGSNCSYFDGNALHQKVQSLGYIAMDDASGNRFGRHLIRAYYFNSMPNELAQEFEKQFDLDADVIKHNFYKEPNPNAYLAKFAPFLIQYKNTDFCQKIITKELTSFIENYIQQYDTSSQVPVHFVGSIAYHLQDEIRVLLAEKGINVGKIIRKPIDGLIQYHANEN
jgi:N-acetylglucosamine kinase-like BadF-type ATPase